MTLMQQGQFADACPKLRASQKIEPKSGTLMVLASCHEQEGKIATAWAEYKEAVGLARSEGRQDYADKATALATGIAPKLSRLRLEPAAGAAPAAMAITIDGAAVDGAALGTALPVDPGEHLVQASAPGRISWSNKVLVGPAADLQTVQIPELAVDPRATQAQPSKAATVQAPAAPVADAEPTEAAVAPWAWVVGSIGVACVVTSVVLRVDQSSASSSIDDRCGSARDACPLDYDFQPDRSREQRDFGLFVGLGAAGLAGIGAAVVGIATSLASPASHTAAQPWQLAPLVGRDLGGVAVSGAY